MTKPKTYTLFQKEHPENQPFHLNLDTIREQAKTFDRERLLLTCLLMCEEIEKLRELAEKPEGLWLQPVWEPPTSETPDGTAFTMHTMHAHGFKIGKAKDLLARTGQHFNQVSPDQAHQYLEMFERLGIGECYVFVGEIDQETYVAFKPNKKFFHPETW